MEETKYEIKTFYSSRKVLEKIQEKNIGFTTEVFEEDEEFTLVPLGNNGTKLFCKLVQVDGQTVIKVDAVESSIVASKAFSIFGNILQMIQGLFTIAAGLFILSFFSVTMTILVASLIAVLLLVAFYMDMEKKKNSQPLIKESKQSMEHLSVLMNGDIIEK